MQDNTKRFSDRVEDYIKYRPSYPKDIFKILQRETLLVADGIIADIGAGTGKLTEVLLQGENRIFAVEPNGPMREASEALLHSYPNFSAMDGTAEQTGLEDHSVDLITVGQAFHWFDIPACRKEFLRILKPEGWVALIWNRRRIHESGFQATYETMLQNFGTDYKTVRHHNVDDTVLQSFFGKSDYTLHSLEYVQEFDFEGLKGRLMSSSYAPRKDHPDHVPMMEALKKVFDEFEEDGKVEFAYDTQIYLGQIKP